MFRLPVPANRSSTKPRVRTNVPNPFYQPFYPAPCACSVPMLLAMPQVVLWLRSGSSCTQRHPARSQMQGPDLGQMACSLHPIDRKGRIPEGAKVGTAKEMGTGQAGAG